jgi:hypothetical protein
MGSRIILLPPLVDGDDYPEVDVIRCSRGVSLSRPFPYPANSGAICDPIVDSAVAVVEKSVVANLRGLFVRSICHYCRQVDRTKQAKQARNRPTHARQSSGRSFCLSDLVINRGKSPITADQKNQLTDIDKGLILVNLAKKVHFRLADPVPLERLLF